MLRSRSYNVAVRSSLGRSSLPPQDSHYFLANKFISVNESNGEEPNEDESWSADLGTLAVKDNIATADLPTTCASSILKSHTSPFEATVVKRLRQLGTVVKGKTNLDEFGMGSHSINSHFGPVSDRSHPQCSVGGSSGGSALAVAKRLSQFALGTDTGGSVRLPAAYTGVVGFKPSYGLISRWGVVPYANSLDTVGILAPSSSNLPAILCNLRNHDPRDPTSVSDAAWTRILQKQRALKPMVEKNEKEHDHAAVTIGVPVEYNIEELDPPIRQTWVSALCLLRKLGYKIAPISLPNTKHALSAYYVLAPAEAASNLAKYDGVRYGSRDATGDGDGDVLYSVTRGKGFGEEVKRRILLGSYTLSASAIDNYFLKAQRVRRLVQRDFDRVFATANPLRPEEQFDISDLHESIPLEDKFGPTQVDFIICPTAPTLPPTLKEAFGQSGVSSYMNDVFTVPASLAGLPAISVPCEIPAEFQEPGMPTVAGIQIIGQYGSDFRVLQVAKQLEHALLTQNEVASEKKISQAKKRILRKKRQRAAYKVAKTLNANNHSDSSDVLRDELGAHLIRKTLLSKHGQKRLEEVQDIPREILKQPKDNTPKIRKYVSGKGDYYRSRLTDKEASALLNNAFEEWPLESDHK